MKTRAWMRRLAPWLLSSVCLAWASPGIGRPAAAGEVGQAPASDPRLDMITALQALGPHPSLGAQANVFGRFVGTWDAEYAEFSKDGKVTRSSGEVIDGWVMDGRALQDLFIIFPSAAHSEGFTGTTLRYFDPKSAAWRVIFVDPENDAVMSFSGGAVSDDRIVLQAEAADGGKTRWSFNDIRPDSFVFRDEASGDGGKTWRLREEDHMRRRGAAPSAGRASAAPGEGQNDFDPLIGRWKYHLRRRLHPLTGSDVWVDYDGTGVCSKVYDGALLDRAEFDGPGGDHIEGLVLRIYDRQAHQWRLYWANRKDGVLDPPQVGEFKDGRGEFFAQDRVNGRVILVRFAWTRMTSDSPHFEQSFSDDGGKTWEVNWITDQTRATGQPDK